MPEHQYHQRSEQSSVFDSRRQPGSRGIGYPSCNTEIALLPPNTKDPHGYYRELGVSPSSTHDEIATAVRRLFRQHHPDTGDGDVERFNLVRNIAEVLLDPISREKYNQTPAGMRLGKYR